MSFVLVFRWIDDYLEIHEKNKAVSFLPKTENLKEIFEYTMTNIKNKAVSEKTISEEMKEDFESIEKFIQQHNLKKTSAGNFPMGQYKVYKNKKLSLCYTNERGFGIIEIGPAIEDNEFFCVDFFKQLYECTNARTSLNIKEQLNFIQKNYNQIIFDLKFNNYEGTFNKINQMLNKS